MTVPTPFPADLIDIARKVVWHDAAENTLADMNTFLAHLMVYGSPSDVRIVEKYVSREGFRFATNVGRPQQETQVRARDAWSRTH